MIAIVHTRQRALHAVCAALMGLVLASCASGPETPAGFVRLQDAFAVAMAPQWTDITYDVGPGHDRVKIFTWDGPRLNQLYLAGGLPVGERLVRAQSGSAPPPPYRRGASQNAKAAFVAGTLAALGYTDVELDRPTDKVFVQLAGMRVAFRASTPDGLLVSGVAALSEGPDGLNAALFVAPSEHYAQALAREVNSIIDSATRDFGGV